MATRQKQKAQQRNAAKENMWEASLRYLPMSARKVRVVADKIRGLSILQVMDSLACMHKGSVRPLRHVIHSAIANAKERSKGVVDDTQLYLHTIAIHKGPMRKRIRARAQGRATRVRKQTAHVDVVVSSKLPEMGGENGTES
ncbi:MAG: 50S ribosomal protein L22 [Myxococcota bacterium]